MELAFVLGASITAFVAVEIEKAHLRWRARRQHPLGRPERIA